MGRGDPIAKLVSRLLEYVGKKPDSATSEEDLWQEHLQIRKLVESLQRKQASYSIAADRTGKSDFGSLVNWLIQHGAVINKVEVAAFEGYGNGLRATEDVDKEERLLSIPARCMLSEETAAQSDKIGDVVQTDNLLSNMPNVALAFHLLTELHDESSFYAPYMHTLPSSFPLPITWPSERLAPMRGSWVWRETLQLYRHIARQYCYLYSRLVDGSLPKSTGLTPSTFTYSDFRWAVCAVMSRQNRIPLRQEDGSHYPGLCLVPLWDMMNHKALESTTGYSAEDDALVFAAAEGTEQGAQVFMNYGSRGNEQYLLYQGFTYADHPHDCKTIVLDLPPDVDARPVKAMLLSNLRIPVPGPFTVHTCAPFDPPLLALARVAFMSKDELGERMRNPQLCAGLGEGDGVVSEVNEARAQRFVEQQVQAAHHEAGKAA